MRMRHSNAYMTSGADDAAGMMETSVEWAVRIEVLSVSDLDCFLTAWLEAKSYTPRRNMKHSDFRVAVTVYGRVVYAASSLVTKNPVRLGGLPCGCDLALGVLPPAQISPEPGEPLLATAPLALHTMRACAAPAPADRGIIGALMWEGWLPLCLCDGQGLFLNKSLVADARIQISVILEEPPTVTSHVALCDAPKAPAAAVPESMADFKEVTPRPSLGVQSSCVSSSILSEEWEDNFERIGSSFRLVANTNAHSHDAQNVNTHDPGSSTGPALLVPQLGCGAGGLVTNINADSHDAQNANSHDPGPSAEGAMTIGSARCSSTGSARVPATPAVIRHTTQFPVAKPNSLASPGLDPGPQEKHDSAPTREVALQQENMHLRQQLELCRQEASSLRSRHDEDRHRVQAKLRELEDEVRGRWQARVSELEREVTWLRVQVAASSSANRAETASSMPVQPSQVAKHRHSVAGPSMGQNGAGMPGSHGFMNQVRWPELDESTLMSAASPLDAPKFPMPSSPNACPKESSLAWTPENRKFLDAIAPLGSPSALTPPAGSSEFFRSPSVSAPQAMQTNMMCGQVQPYAARMPPADMLGPSSSNSQFFGQGQQASGQVNLFNTGGLQPPRGLCVPALGPINLGLATHEFSSSGGDQYLSDPLLHEPQSSVAKIEAVAPAGTFRLPQQGLDFISDTQLLVKAGSRPPSPPRQSASHGSTQAHSQLSSRTHDAFSANLGFSGDHFRDRGPSINLPQRGPAKSRSRSVPALLAGAGEESSGLFSLLGSISGLYAQVSQAVRGASNDRPNLSSKLDGRAERKIASRFSAAHVLNAEKFHDESPTWHNS